MKQKEYVELKESVKNEDPETSDYWHQSCYPQRLLATDNLELNMA